MIALFEQGGPVMIIILLGSIIALTIFFERLYYLRIKFHIPLETQVRIKELSLKNMTSFVDYLRTHQKPLHYLILKLIDCKHLSQAEASDRILPYMETVKKQMNRGIDVLSTIASISPLLGLLGTVIGMLHVFQSIYSQGLGNPSLLAGGISEALLTTIAGLLVAIPTFVAFKFVKARAEQMLSVFEGNINLVFELIFHSRREE